MNAKNLIPWRRGEREQPARRDAQDFSPFLALQRDMNRLFDGFFNDTFLPGGLGRLVGAWPKVDVSDNGDRLKIHAELPGMEEKDIEITFQEGMLTLRGEKKAETDDNSYSERWHGTFERSIQLGPDVDPDQAKATFRNGVLTVTVPKRPENQRTLKRIPIAS